MKQHISKSELTQLIASGHEQKAFNKIIELAEFQNQENQQLIYLLSNRYKKLQKELLIGNISSENAAVRSADINYDLLSLIDQISFTEKEKPIAQNIPKIKNDIPTKKLTLLSEMIKPTLVVFALLASFFFLKNQFNTIESTEHQKSWVGEWTQTKVNDEGALTPGLLFFFQEGNQWKGRSTNQLLNGGESTDSLFNIHFLEDGKKLTGNWINSDEKYFPELKGTFTFCLLYTSDAADE